AGEKGEAEPGLRIAFAAEFTELEAAAPLVDQLIAERIGDAERLLGSAGAAPNVTGGVPLRAVRTERLRLASGNAVERITGDAPVVAWTFAPGSSEPRDDGAPVEHDRGWCVLSLSGADQDP